jgi:hypothetical protein
MPARHSGRIYDDVSIRILHCTNDQRALLRQQDRFALCPAPAPIHAQPSEVLPISET